MDELSFDSSSDLNDTNLHPHPADSQLDNEPIPEILAALIAYLPAPAFVLRPHPARPGELVIGTANQLACQTWEAAASQLIGHPVGDVFQEPAEFSRQNRWEPLLNHEAVAFNTRFLTLQEHAFQARLGAQWINIQNCDYYIAVTHKPQKRMLDPRPRLSHCILQNLLSATQMPLYFKDMRGYYLGSNQAFATGVNLSFNDFVAKTTADVFSLEVQTQIKELDRLVHQKDGEGDSTLITRNEKGRPVAVQIYKTLLRDEDGVPVGYVGLLTSASAEFADPKQLLLIPRAEPYSLLSHFSFTDLFDLGAIQKLQDSFSAATGVASIITQTDGTPITQPSNFCRLCSHVIRQTEKGLANCMYSDAVTGKYNPNGPNIQPCLSCGLWDAGASISVRGVHIANWLIGQVKNESQDPQQMLEYAAYIGADIETFASAYAEVNEMSFERFKQIADLVYLLANHLSEQAYQNLLQAQFISKQSETEISLRASQERLTIATRGTGIAVWEWDLAHNEFTWDDGMYGLYGIEHGSRDDLFEAYQERLHPEDAERVAREAAATLAGESEYSTVYRICLPDGSIRHIAAQALVIRDDDGAPVRLVGINRDVTIEATAAEEQRKLEQQLRQTQKLEAIGTLAGGIAHDFNNILFAITGNTELALDDAESGSQLETCLQEIQRAAQRASKLVYQLLAFAKPSEGKQEPTLVKTVIEEVMQIIRATIPANISIYADPGPTGLTVVAGATELHQILLNLCTNAYQAMQNSGGVLSLSAAAHFEPAGTPLHSASYLPPGSYIGIIVKDTGKGIPAEIRERIFEPFFTTRPVGQGSGMGLAVVHGLVKSLGGVIRMESETERGSEFHVFLPASEPAADAPQELPQQSIPRGQGEQVLYVEDEEAVADVISVILRGLGYQVEHYFEPEQALAAFIQDSHRFAIVLTDQSMPGMSGGELTRRIHQLQPQMPVLIATGNRQRVVPEDIQHGPCLLLDKPVRRVDLAMALAKLLHNQPNISS